MEQRIADPTTPRDALELFKIRHSDNDIPPQVQQQIQQQQQQQQTQQDASPVTDIADYDATLRLTAAATAVGTVNVAAGPAGMCCLC